MSVLSSLKNRFVSDETKPWRILTGPFKGMVMNLNLQGQMLVYLGLYEKETHRWLRRLSRDIATAIDIGVAYGEYTIYFLTRTKATKVYGFEPDKQCLPLLRQHLERNAAGHLDHLDLSSKFVGASETDQAIRLDSLVKSVRTPVLVKLDVEGAEAEVLRGAKALNGLADVRWLIETHSKELEVSCVEILRAAGFQTRIIPLAWWRRFLPEGRYIEHNRWLAAWKDK